MKKHQNSLTWKITFSYGLLFFFLVIVISTIYYFTAYHNFLKTHSETSRQLAKIISNQTDERVETANAIQKRILESEDILQYIFSEVHERDVTKDWKFRQNLYSITGYNYEFYHLNIVNLSDSFLLPFGEEYYYKEYQMDTDTYQKIVEPTLLLDGALNILPPDTGCLYAPHDEVPVFSLLRSFGRYPLGTKNAIIEIQLSVNSLENMVSNILYTYNNGGERVLILDQNGKPVYAPGFTSDELNDYAAKYIMKDHGNASPLLSGSELITTHKSAMTGFTTFLITPKSYLVENQRFYLLICLAFFAITFLLMAVITRSLAHRITAPIVQLKEKISSLELEHIAQEDYNYISDRTFNELEILNESYNRMQRRLKKSLDEVVTSKTLTIQSQMMALQAQMDSHFLYNTLTIISIIAEDNDDEQAASMCIKLTQMLRYITEDISKDTAFIQELTHTRNYTDLITIRFGTNVMFEYDIDPGLDSIRVPRLIIQPLVENCVKYSRKPEQILKVSIRAWIQEDYWYVNIQDNGDGFSPEALRAIRQKIQELDLENKNPVLNISGMGLINIYLRLKLYYNNCFIFKLENKTDETQDHGVSITIGGILK